MTIINKKERRVCGGENGIGRIAVSRKTETEVLRMLISNINQEQFA